jgi:hypothetical protein
MQRVGEVFLIREGSACVAYLRPADGSPDRYLCAADGRACSVHPHLQEHLIGLAADIAVNLDRAPGERVLPRAPFGAMRG